MKKHLLLAVIAAGLLASCTSDKPERIETDQKPPHSPCACGPRVTPLLWEAA